MLCLLALSLLAAPSSMDLASASPDTPVLELGWRSGMRAKAGGRIRFFSDADDIPGPFFDFMGFLELHNAPSYFGVIPFEFWRGRLALEGGYRWTFAGERPWGLQLTAAIEHESDHSTSPSIQF